MTEFIVRGARSLGLYGSIVFFVLLAFGLRTFWDTNRVFIPHVLEFNMYVHSFSADDGTDLPDIKVMLEDHEITLDKEELKSTTMGYLHLSDRWDFYPPLYDSYFCDSGVAEKLFYDRSKLKKIEISYVKNYSSIVVYKQEIKCQ